MPDGRHADVAAYVLGSLSQEEETEFRRHLSECAECRRDVGWMSELSAALSIDLSVLGPPPPRRRSRRVIAAVAIVVVACAVAVLSGIGRDGEIGGTATPVVADAVNALFKTGDIHGAGDPATGLTVELATVPAGEGTTIGIRLTDPAGPKQCELVTVATSGEWQAVARWQVPAGGYTGTTELLAQGTTRFPAAQIARFEISSAGRTLLVIPA